jgi:hypothetical protein
MSHTFTKIHVDRKFTNAPALHLSWVANGEEAHASWTDDEARGAIDANGFPIESECDALIDALAGSVAIPETLAAKLTAASDATAELRQATLASSLAHQATMDAVAARLSAEAAQAAAEAESARLSLAIAQKQADLAALSATP